MRLGVKVGKGCAALMDGKMRDLSCQYLQFDAWAYHTDDPKKPKRHVAVLHIAPVVSPQTAVRAAIIQGFRDAEA